MFGSIIILKKLTIIVSSTHGPITTLVQSRWPRSFLQSYGSWIEGPYTKKVEG